MQLQFNANAVQPQQPMEPVPASWYNVVLKKLEPENNSKEGSGWHLSGELEIIDGQYKGRKGYINLNIGHTSSQQAVEIAQRELSALCHVTGRYVINDTAELLNIPFQAKFELEGSQNRIKGYKDAMGNDPGKQGGAGGAPQTQPAAMPPAPAPQQQPQWGQQGGTQAQGGSGWGQPPAPQQQPAMQPQGGQQPAWGGGQGQPQGGQPAWNGGGQQQPQGGGQPSWNGGGAAAPQAQQPAGNQQWQPQGGAQGGQPAWARQ